MKTRRALLGLVSMRSSVVLTLLMLSSNDERVCLKLTFQAFKIMRSHERRRLWQAVSNKPNRGFV
jgi:tRNA pseudouridine-54 N-methylase